MMEILENIVLFVDVIIFFQNEFSVVVLPHHSEDILFDDLESSLFRSILQAGKQIIRPALQQFELPL